MNNEKELTHIDLFSGIGGFTLAAEWAGFRTVAFCEKEEFCQKVLKKRFGAVVTDSEYLRKLQSEGSKQDKWRWIGNLPVLIPEIRDFDGTKWTGATLLTGGFPCQPFSVAGQRRGKEDDRYLWPEMRRIISEAKPRWILAENVPGIFRMALDTVLTDLEGEGYTTGTFIIPACGLNAPHRRNRVWIVANYGISQPMELSGSQQKCRNRISNSHQDVADSTSKRKESISQQRQRNGIKPADNHASDPKSPECKQSGRTWAGRKRFTDNAWQEDWHEVAARFCRVDDGVPDRIHRLEALGNAIVPQIAYEILKYIKQVEEKLIP